MFRLGLTGSIGMGKTTTAGMFAALGCPVWDADAAVERLYSKGGGAVDLVRTIVPSSVIEGAVDRSLLRRAALSDKTVLRKLEDAVHPLVGADREKFAADNEEPVAVFDVPLLFETGLETQFDAVACVFVDSEEQQRRVLARGTLTLEEFRVLLAKQMPAKAKCARSDYVIRTDDLQRTKGQVLELADHIQGIASHARNCS